jgi:hypothetical protein
MEQLKISTNLETTPISTETNCNNRIKNLGIILSALLVFNATPIANAALENDTTQIIPDSDISLNSNRIRYFFRKNIIRDGQVVTVRSPYFNDYMTCFRAYSGDRQALAYGEGCVRVQY